MTRLKMSIGILLILLCLSLTSGKWTQRRCTEMQQLIIQAAEETENGDNKAAEKTSAELCRQWESFRTWASLIIKNDMLREIDRLCARLPELAEHEDSFGSDLSELNVLVEDLKHRS